MIKMNIKKQDNCLICKEKQVEINRILKAYAKEKKLLFIIIGILFLTNLFTLAFGAKGLTMVFELVGGLIR